MDDDWDLQAVVRGCCSTATTTTTTTTTTATATSTSTSSSTSPSVTTTTSGGAQQLFSSFTPQQDVNFSSFQDLLEPRKQSFFEDLQELYKPFFRQSTNVSPLSVLGGLQDLTQQTQLIQPKQAVVAVKSSSHTPTPRSKRRKNHLKRVSHVPAESLSNDPWSWRKYGQKPIKGSPYPRGYYKCSTSKGCMARKQVERNRSDPGMFIVTYTAEHNHPKPTHRNSLAGSTRQKPTTSTPSADADDSEKPTCSTPVSTSESPSTAPEKLESSREEQAEADGEDDEFSVSNMDLDDDFFVGLEEFTGPDAGDLLSDQFPGTLQFPWHASNATTTAAGSS